MVAHPTIFLAAHDATTDVTEIAQQLLRLAFAVLPCLASAYAAFGVGRVWQSWIFFLMACMSTTSVYLQSCNAGADVLNVAFLLEDVWSHVCLLQTALMLAGPEDPHMQWIDHPLVHSKALTMAARTPLDVIVASRIVPLIAVAVLPMLHTTASPTFHWQLILVCEALFLFSSTYFWTHQDRRSSAPKVLIRMQFWWRFMRYMVLPVSVLAGVSCFAKAKGFELPELWHASVALIGMLAVHDIWRDKKMADEVVNTTPHNPLVVRALLVAPAALGAGTLACALACDWWVASHWRWPSIVGSGLSSPAVHVLVGGALPTLTALSAAFWLIKSTGDPMSLCGSRAFCHHEGCFCSCCGALIAVVAFAHASVGWPVMARCGAVVSLVTIVAGMMLTVLNVPPMSLPSFKESWRLPMTGASACSVWAYVTCLVWAHMSTATASQAVSPKLAIIEYVALLLPLFWPATWWMDVEDRWQVHMPHSRIWVEFSNM